MKKLFVIALLVLGTATFAQSKKENRSEKKTSEKEKMTSEQKTQKQVEKLSSELNLTTSQQKEIEKVLAEQNLKKEAKKAERKINSTGEKTKPSSDERMNMSNEMLAEQTATKEKMRKILDKEQFEKWEKSQDQRKNVSQKKGKGNKKTTKEGAK